MAEAAKTSLSSGLDALADVEAHHPPRDELGENGRHQGPTRCRSCWLIRSRRRRRLRSHLDSTPSRTSRLTILPETSSERMDGTRDQPGAARAGSSVVRMFQVPSLWDNAHQAGARCACPVVTGLKHWLFTHC